MNSKAFKGQTIGKKLLKIRVVNSDNQTISFGKSTLRYIVLAVPFFLSESLLSSEVLPAFSAYPLAAIIFGGSFAIEYLYTVNQVNRQSLHDLAVGTYVVNANAEQQATGKIWKGHLFVVAVIFIATAFIPVLTSKLEQYEPYQKMLMFEANIANSSEVTYSQIITDTDVIGDTNLGPYKASMDSLRASFQSSDVSDDAFARHVAAMLVDNYSEQLPEDLLKIMLSQGYKTGILLRFYQRLIQ